MPSVLLILLLISVGLTKVMAQTYTYTPSLQTVPEGNVASLTSTPMQDTIWAKTVGVIPYSDEFITQEEVIERYYAITSFRMIDTATVAVLTGASDMILVYSLIQNQILHKIQLPMTARAFDYDNNLFHVIGDRTYLTIDAEGMIHERRDFQQPQLPNEEIFIITDLKVLDGQPIIHECNANTYGITFDGLQKIDTFYYDHARGCKTHPQFIDEGSFALFNETPSRSGRLTVSMESLGLEGKLASLDYISVDDDYVAINLQTTYNCTGSFVKSYLLVLNLNGELVNLVEVPINFLSYISKPFQYRDNAWYYAFSGQEGVSFFEIGMNTNMLASPDSYEVSDEEIGYSYPEPENGTTGEGTNNDDLTRGNWRTITQTWYNANQYCILDWTPIQANLATSCTWVGNSGYIITPITSYGYTETGVPYKWGGFTDRMSFVSLASQGKYTGNRVTTTSCGGNAYSSNSDTYVIGVDCSGYVSNCWEVSRHTTSNLANICSDYGLVTSASNSAFQNGDALNKAGDHVMLYRGHNSSTNKIMVFQSSARDWKTSPYEYQVSYFSGYRILRYNNMKNIILRLNSAITMSQNGSTVTNVTQGEPLTVTYSVKNFGSEVWEGYVQLYIEQSNGTLMCIKSDQTTLVPNDWQSFTFSNNGVSSPLGTTKFYVKVKNYDAGGYYGERSYDVGASSYANPLVFQIVEGGGGGSCSDCPDYDESWSISGNGEWTTKSSSIGTDGCRIYRVPMLPSYTYTFQTCGEGSASFDTRLYLYNASCNQVAFDDDGCTGNSSLLEYTNTGNAAYYYLRIDGYNGAGGTFTIAGKREAEAAPCPDCPEYDDAWNVNSVEVGEWTTKSSSIVSGGCKIYRVPLMSSYTYTFQTCGEGNADFDTQLYLFDASCNQVAYDDDGCTGTLSSIEYTNTGSTAYFYLKINGYGTNSGSYTIAAKRESPTYVINASANPSNGGTVSGSGSYNYGSYCTLTATSSDGYIFVNWTENGNVVSTESTYSFTVNGNRSLVANFLEDPRCSLVFDLFDSYGDGWNGNKLTVSHSDGSYDEITLDSGSSGSQTLLVSNGSQVVLGWIAGSWTSECSFDVSYANGNVIYHGENMNGDFSYAFQMDCDEMPATVYNITVSASPGTGGSVSGTGAYACGSSCTLTATANTGYTFVNWTKNGQQVSTSATYSFTVTESGNYVANFSQNSYTISASANPSNGGTVSGAGSYNHGSTCTLTATPNSGYIFDHWTKNGTTITGGATISFAVTENATYVAYFTAQGQTYNITTAVSPMGSGYVSGGGTYQQGQTCVLTATPNSGYVFDHWTKNGSQISGDATISFIVTQTANYAAYFTAQQEQTYTINATANPSNGGTVSGGGAYQQGQSCVLMATANTGYVFVNWTENGNPVSTSASYTFTVTGNRSLVANFAADDGSYHWDVNIYSYSNTMTYVGIIKIDDVEQMTTMLEIGAFCGDECRGRERAISDYYQAYNHYFVFLTVYGNDGDQISFRLYDHAVGEELDLTCPTQAFQTNGVLGNPVNPYVFDFSLSQITQVTNLSLGWNWWSTYVEADDLLGQLKTGLGANAQQIKSNTTFVNYFNGMWFGGLNSINNESCYLIQATSPCTVEMTGNPASPTNHPIAIHTNWNWIGYPNTGAMGIANAFGNITPANGDQVKSQSAFSTYFNGMWMGGLNTIIPGMGMLYKSNNSGTITLVYPEANRSEEQVENVTNEDNHWTADYYAYPSNMTVMAVVELDDEELSGEHYEVAAFANGECRGSARLMYVAPINRYVAFLTVVGDEASELRFSLYDSETGVVETQDFASLQYETNVVIGSLETPYVIRFRGTTGMDEWTNSVSIFPNPVNCGERFSLGLPAVETLRATSVQIVNALGVVVETLRATSVPAHITAPKVAGVYTLRITVEGKGVCYRKLVVK